MPRNVSIVCVLLALSCWLVVSPRSAESQDWQQPHPVAPGLANSLLTDDLVVATANETFTEFSAAPQSVEQRLAAVEKELKKQNDAAAKKKEADAKKPSFQIGGQLQIDYLWVGQDAANRATVGDVNDEIDIRRARFVARGETHEVVEYMIGFDFGLAGRPTFLDVWVGLRELPVLGHVRGGALLRALFAGTSDSKSAEHVHGTFASRRVRASAQHRHRSL